MSEKTEGSSLGSSNVHKHVWAKNTKKEEDNENGECSHAVKPRDCFC